MLDTTSVTFEQKRARGLSSVLPVGFPVWITSLHKTSLSGKTFRLLGRVPASFIKRAVIPIDIIDEDIKAALIQLNVAAFETIDAITTEEFDIEGCNKSVFGYECTWEPRL